LVAGKSTELGSRKRKEKKTGTVKNPEKKGVKKLKPTQKRQSKKGRKAQWVAQKKVGIIPLTGPIEIGERP